MEITEKINKLTSAWEEFKSRNEIEEYQNRLEKIEAYIGRPSHGKKEDNEYKASFVEYLKKGITTNSMNYMGNFSDGFPLEHGISEKVISDMSSFSPFRKICDVESISGTYMTYVFDKSNFQADWNQEGLINKGDDIDKFKLINIYTYPLYSQPKTTQSVLDDVSIDIEKWLVERISVVFSKKESDAFINGKDDDKPRGILNYIDEESDKDRRIDIVTCAKQDAISMDDIISLYYSLPSEYAANGAFLMHSTTAQHLRSMKSEKTDQYFWEANFSRPVPDTLMGSPVYICNELPKFSDGLYTVIFADFKRAYKIVDRKQINVMRDPYSFKPYVAFYVTKRVGGDLVDSRAIKILKMKRA